MGPKFLHIVLYEYLTYFLTHPLKILHSKKWRKKKHMVLKLSSSGEPSKNKKVPKNKIQNQKWFQKCDLEPFLVQ